MKSFITQNFGETKNLAAVLAEDMKSGQILALTGDLGAGKTTFAQGLLEALGAEGPYTSPTFVIMKQYQGSDKMIYHIDAYRVNTEDILNLGWEEMIANKNNVIIVEWADRISDIIPHDVLWINFEWLDENKRKIIIK